MMKKILTVLILFAVLSMSGCTDTFNDDDVINQYNEYVDTYNADSYSYNLIGERLSDAIAERNDAIEEMMDHTWGSERRYDESDKSQGNIKNEFNIEAMKVRRHLISFQSFIDTNRVALERNDVDTYRMNLDISDWIAEIDYNIKYAGNQFKDISNPIRNYNYD